MGEAVFKVLLDTSVYIPYINQGIEHPILELREKAPLLYMSAVVMEESYASHHLPIDIYSHRSFLPVLFDQSF